MKIGIIGSGMVGQNLAKGFVQTGHEVVIGTRDVTNPKVKEAVNKLGSKVKLGTFSDAAKFGDLTVFAINWAGVDNAIKLAQPANLAGKIVIDTTNPLDFSTDKLKLGVSGNDSSGEKVQRLLPDSKVVKAFNIIGAADMFKPKFHGGPPTMIIAGNDKDAKQQVTKILNSFEWPDVVDLGDIENARYLEPLLMVRMVHAMNNNSWVAPAFKFIKQAN